MRKELIAPEFEWVKRGINPPYKMLLIPIAGFCMGMIVLIVLKTIGWI